jgi:hypothetical protein
VIAPGQIVESAGPSTQRKASKNASRKGSERKNNVPTPFRCNACQKFMCSQRSLRRHKSTCKLYLKTTPELTPEEKHLIAKNEENRCENCGKVLGSPSNLRRHQNGCKQKSEDESKPPLSTTVQPNNSPSRNPTIVEHLTNQVVTTSDASLGSKRLMPPPEAQNTHDASQFHLYSQQMKYPADSVTVGEHLRHCYKSPNTTSPTSSKQGSRRPPILGRKTSLQNQDLSIKLEDPFDEPPATCPPASGQALSPAPSVECHSRSAPPSDMNTKLEGIKKETKFESDEAIRKSEQVLDVINSVVEKIRRQNVAEQGEKRSNDSSPPTKMARVEEQARQINRPLTSIITTQPLPATSTGHMLPSPRYNPGFPNNQPMVMQQQAISQIQVPLVAEESNDESKVVARYMCPECFKL